MGIVVGQGRKRIDTPGPSALNGSCIRESTRCIRRAVAPIGPGREHRNTVMARNLERSSKGEFLVPTPLPASPERHRGFSPQYQAASIRARLPRGQDSPQRPYAGSDSAGFPPHRTRYSNRRDPPRATGTKDCLHGISIRRHDMVSDVQTMSIRSLLGLGYGPGPSIQECAQIRGQPKKQIAIAQKGARFDKVPLIPREGPRADHLDPIARHVRNRQYLDAFRRSRSRERSSPTNRNVAPNPVDFFNIGTRSQQ